MESMSEEVQMYESKPSMSAGVCLFTIFYIWQRTFNEQCTSVTNKSLGAILISAVVGLSAMAWPGPLSHIVLAPSMASGTSAEEPCALSHIANVSTGVVLIFATALILAEPLRLISNKASLRASYVAAVLVCHALHEGYGNPRIVHKSFELGRLSKAFDNFRIVQLTDIHVGATVGRSQLQKVVKRVNELNPDLIVITGDLIDGFDEPALIRSALEPLSQLRSAMGSYYVTGNHEYYFGSASERVLGELEGHLNEWGIRRLKNEFVSIGDPLDNELGFDLAGIDDFDNGGNVSAAVAGRDPERELVLLAHQPNSIRSATQHGVGLQLSGHTHGGQMFPLHYACFFTNSYVAGAHVHEEHGQSTQIYVSRGTRQGGAPMRLFAPTEITHLTLRSKHHLIQQPTQCNVSESLEYTYPGR